MVEFFVCHFQPAFFFAIGGIHPNLFFVLFDSALGVERRLTTNRQLFLH